MVASQGKQQNFLLRHSKKNHVCIQNNRAHDSAEASRRELLWSFLSD
jgi:hypothetical protein